MSAVDCHSLEVVGAGAGGPLGGLYQWARDNPTAAAAVGAGAVGLGYYAATRALE